MAIFSANSIPSNAKFLWGTMCLVWRGIVSLTLKTSLSPCRNLLLNIKYIMELIVAFVWEIQKKRSGTGARRAQYFERLRTLIKWFTWAKSQQKVNRTTMETKNLNILWFCALILSCVSLLPSGLLFRSERPIITLVVPNKIKGSRYNTKTLPHSSNVL